MGKNWKIAGKCLGIFAVVIMDLVASLMLWYMLKPYINSDLEIVTTGKVENLQKTEIGYTFEVKGENFRSIHPLFFLSDVGFRDGDVVKMVSYGRDAVPMQVEQDIYELKRIKDVNTISGILMAVMGLASCLWYIILSSKQIKWLLRGDYDRKMNEMRYGKKIAVAYAGED